MADMGLDRATNLHRGVIRVSAAVPGKGDVGHRLARCRLLDEQRQNRVIERGGGKLDLALRGQLSVQRDDAGHQLALAGQQPLLLVFGVVAAFRLEVGQIAFLLEEQGVDPRQVRPDLKVAEVAGAERERAPRAPDDVHAERSR